MTGRWGNHCLISLAELLGAAAVEPSGRLPVEPHVFEAPAVVDAVDHRGQPFYVRLPAGRTLAVRDDRPGAVLLQLAVDLPHQPLAFFLIGFGRLSVELFFEFGVAVSAVIAIRAARVIFIELLVWIVDAAAGIVHRHAIVLAGPLCLPIRGLYGVELAGDVDLLELVYQDDRLIPVGGDVARRYLDRKPLVVAIAELLHDRSRRRTVLLHVGVVTRYRLQQLRWHAPDAFRGWQHCAADLCLPLTQYVDKRFAVQCQRHRAPEIHIVEGRHVAVDQEIAAAVRRPELADRVRRLALDIFQQRDAHDVGPGHVELAGDETEDRRRAVWHNRVVYAVEIGPIPLPVIGISGDLDRLVRLELDEFERAGADRVAAHVARRDVARIDRRIAGGEQGDKGRLRPL